MNVPSREADLKNQIIVTLGLAENGFIEVESEGELTRRFRSFASSTGQVSSVLSKLIREGLVVRSRRERGGIGDDDRPITFFLACRPVPTHVQEYWRHTSLPLALQR